ncbi:MAG: hypothetical protein QGH51_01090 [Planctomycetota bacterium]|nr:hypothetical protein [Planctomycetota bacterium]MDP6940596.1 hypothetical protein [Planctomycetota bacterium]
MPTTSLLFLLLCLLPTIAWRGRAAWILIGAGCLLLAASLGDGITTGVPFSIGTCLAAWLHHLWSRLEFPRVWATGLWWSWLLFPVWIHTLSPHPRLIAFWPGNLIQIQGWDPIRLEPLYTIWGSQSPTPPSTPWPVVALQLMLCASLYWAVRRKTSSSSNQD